MELIATTIPALIRQQAAAHGGETILRKKERGIWHALTWTELDRRVREIGLGLCALGVRPGESVALLSETRPELVFADLAVLSCGAIGVALNTGDEPAHTREMLNQASAVVAIVEGEEQLDKLLTIRGQCPVLRAIVIMDMKGLRAFQDDGCVSLADLIASGASRTDWETVTNAVNPGASAARLVTRAGLSAPLTHAEIMRKIDAAAVSLGVRAGDERLAVLPMSDPAERLFGLYLALKYRIVSNYLENPETATENLREVKPTVLGANVEAWERLHERVSALAAAATGVQKLLYNWAIAARQGGGIAASLANILVMPAVRAELGFGNLRVAFVGDGTPPPEIARWARALGITVKQIDQ